MDSLYLDFALNHPSYQIFHIYYILYLRVHMLILILFVLPIIF